MTKEKKNCQIVIPTYQRKCIRSTVDKIEEDRIVRVKYSFNLWVLQLKKVCLKEPRGQFRIM
jgi:hypothetical protein